MLRGWNVSIGSSLSKDSPTISECPYRPSTRGDTDTKVHPAFASVDTCASGGATLKGGSTISSTRFEDKELEEVPGAIGNSVVVLTVAPNLHGDLEGGATLDMAVRSAKVL